MKPKMLPLQYRVIYIYYNANTGARECEEVIARFARQGEAVMFVCHMASHMPKGWQTKRVYEVYQRQKMVYRAG